MRGVDINAKARGVERCIGIDVVTTKSVTSGRVLSFSAYDPVLDRPFVTFPDRPSDAERALKKLHEDIYHARGEYVYRQQKRRCCFCDRPLPSNAYEVDHISSRGAHGRSDAISNLRVCCTGLRGCGEHRRRHGG